MDFYEYLTRQYQNLNLDIQAEYSVVREGQLKAANKLINAQVTFHRWLGYAKHIVCFWLYKLSLKSPGANPVDRFKVLQADATAKQEAIKAAKAAQNSITMPIGQTSGDLTATNQGSPVVGTAVNS